MSNLVSVSIMMSKNPHVKFPNTYLNPSDFNSFLIKGIIIRIFTP